MFDNKSSVLVKFPVALFNFYLCFGIFKEDIICKKQYMGYLSIDISCFIILNNVSLNIRLQIGFKNVEDRFVLFLNWSI